MHAFLARTVTGCVTTLFIVGSLISGSAILPQYLRAQDSLVADSVTPTAHSDHLPGRWAKVRPIGDAWMTAWGPVTTSTTQTRIANGLPRGVVRANSLATSADLIVDSLDIAGAGTDASLCANSCFGMTTSYTTIPYFSLDAPRNVTLQYFSEYAAPRPIAFADVRINSTSTKTLKEYWLQVVRNGTAVTFVNGDTKLRFAAPSPQSTAVRIGGQWDNRSNVTQVDSLVYTITAVWSDNSTQAMAFSVIAPNLNGIRSSYGRGWWMGGLQQLFIQANGRVLVWNGDGSATTFVPNGTGVYRNETNADFTLLTSTGSGSNTIYTRTGTDSSRVQFNYLGQELRAITSTLDTTSFAYDSVGHLTKIYDPYRTYSGTNRSYIALSYNANGFLTKIQEPGGNGTPSTGRATYYGVATSDSSLLTITDPDGVFTTFNYSANKLLNKMINRHGDTTRYVYKSTSWLLDTVIAPTVPTDAGGGTTTLQKPQTAFTPWQTFGVPTTTTATTPAAASIGSSIKATVKDPLGRPASYTVNAQGLNVATTTPLNQTTTIAYDTSWTELPLVVTNPDGRIDSVVYAAGTPNVTSSASSGDSTVYYHYTVNGQLDSVWTKGGLATRYFYNATTALLDSVRDGGSSALVTRYTYNSARRLTQVADVSGHLTVTHYDPVFGNLDSTSAPGAGYSKTYFDAFGRDTLHLVKGAPYPIRTVYDTLNRVIKTWSKGFTGDTVSTTYDALFVTRTKVPQGNTVYKTDNDAFGRVTRRYDGVDTTKYLSYRYDLGGRTTSWTNRRGQRVDVQYDSLDRVTQQSGTNLPTDIFTYASNNLILTASRSGVSVDSTFANVSGAIDSVVHRMAGHRYRFAATQSDGADMSQGSTTITSDVSITWVQPSQVSRYGATSLDSITLSPGAGGGTLVRTTNADGVPTQVQWPSSVPTRTTSYTARQWPYRVAFAGAGAFQDSMARDYLRDTLGRIVAQWRKRGTGYESWHYTYDGLGRITKTQQYNRTSCTPATDTILGVSYSCTGNTLLWADSTTYDAGGNGTPTGATYSTTGNRVLTWPGSGGGATYTYDADGNIATRAQGGVTDTLYWNAMNQLDSIRSMGSRVRYEYNSAGYPVRRSSGGAVDRIWLWEGDQLAAELDATGAHRIAQYLYEGTDRPYAMATDSGTGSVIRYMQLDEVGNVIGISRGNSLKQALHYSVSGVIDQTSFNTILDTNRLAWKGLFYEGNDTRLYFMRHRWYDSQISRFISEDPIGLGGGGNFYAFASDDPINGSDPTGLSVCFNDASVGLATTLGKATGTTFTVIPTAIPWVDGTNLKDYSRTSLCISPNNVYYASNGPGPLQNRLRQLINANGVTSNVFVHRVTEGTTGLNWGVFGPKVSINLQSVDLQYATIDPIREGFYKATYDNCARHMSIINTFDLQSILVHEILGHAYGQALYGGRDMGEYDAILMENYYHSWVKPKQALRYDACKSNVPWNKIY